VLNGLYESTIERFSADPAAAAKLVGIKDCKADEFPVESEKRKALVERASMTVVANVILNLDDFLNN
jgi:hypothetical protein